SFAPPQNTAGVANFPVGVVQVPQSLHVRLGSARTGRASLELGHGGTPTFTCTYDGSADGISYALSSCTGGVQAGHLVGAGYAPRAMAGGDESAGPIKIRAQLAKNPVGDAAGSDLIPPMPTFWGDTPDSASQIATDYFNAVTSTQATEEQFVQAPVPEFA